MSKIILKIRKTLLDILLINTSAKVVKEGLKITKDGKEREAWNWCKVYDKNGNFLFAYEI